MDELITQIFQREGVSVKRAIHNWVLGTLGASITVIVLGIAVAALVNNTGFYP